MAYFKINDNDYSMYTNALKVETKTVYRSQTSAAGNTVVDKANSKRIIEVGIIPLDNYTMGNLLRDLEDFEVLLSFRDPKTNAFITDVRCIIPSHEVEYYTIQAGNVSFKAFNLKFTEL